MVSVKWTFFIFFLNPTIFSEGTRNNLIVQKDSKEIFFQDYDYGKAPGNFYNVIFYGISEKRESIML